MASSGPPDRLAPRHELIALLIAAGKTNVEIARAVGVTANRISTIRQSPLMAEAVRHAQRYILDRVTQDVAERLNGEAGPTLDRLVQLRDTAEEERVRLGAANSLADRISSLSRRTVTEGEATIRVLFGAVEVRRMITAALEDEGRTAADLDDLDGDDGERVVPLSLAEAQRTFTQRGPLAAVPDDDEDT